MTEPSVPQKPCTKCKQVKPLSEYHRDRSKRSGRISQCKECANAAALKYLKRPGVAEARKISKVKYKLANPHKFSAERQYVYHLRYEYGITIDQYQSMYASQNGRCGICQRPGEPRRLAVDHDHETGVVRGLLCNSCNYGLGILGDNLTSINRVVSYLKQSESQLVKVLTHNLTDQRILNPN